MARWCYAFVVAALLFGASPRLGAQTEVQLLGPMPDHSSAPLRTALARPGSPGASPYITLRAHNVNNLRFTITNWGTFGSLGGELIDPETGQPAEGAYYPAGYNYEHLYLGALWVGAVIGTDTLVSTAHDDFYWITEFYPESFFNGGGIVERSSREGNPYYDPGAMAEQEFTCTYYDTLTSQAYVPADQWSWRPHKPLRLRVRQESFAWPYGYAEDFVIIRYWITNMRGEALHDVRVGFLIDPEVMHIGNVLSYSDDQIGFRDTLPSITGYGFQDTLRLLWFADNDGDPAERRYFNDQSVTSAAGIGVIGAPVEIYRADYPWWPYNCWQSNLEYSFNWWYPSTDGRYDWGPQRAPVHKSWVGGAGEPLGDRQKYRFMASGEIDYDQAWANVSFAAQGWINPPHPDEYFANNLARGSNTHALLAVGPFDVPAGDSIPIALAFACGEKFHNDPRNAGNLPQRQKAYFERLDFSDLSRNFQWARWVYDNPGKDTDGDGCSGNYRTVRCRDTILYWEEWPYHDVVCDTVFYSGDAVPDLKGPPPPPAPELSITSEPGKIHLNWDGSRSETFYDDFSRRKDFEGYNVYLGLGHNPNTLALMTSWDRTNYDRYRYIPQARPSPWLNDGPPLTFDELAAMYSPDFDPRLHSDPQSYYQDNAGNRFYFQPHGGNRGNEYYESGVMTINPIQLMGVDSVWNDLVKTWDMYGRYECTVDGLLPSQPYYFAVTAFDHGFPEGRLDPLESSTQANMRLAYPSYTPESVVQKKLDVSVYPNPYKIDDGYREHRYEDPNRTGFVERTRRIHFVNLPPRATIKIFSLDGDLIRELHHPDSRFSDSPSHTAWDLITRNTQAVVSGIYLYSIESEWGNQIGKIIIIK